MIERLEDHFIICGYGRVGRRAADEFAAYVEQVTRVTEVVGKQLSAV